MHGKVHLFRVGGIAFQKSKETIEDAVRLHVDEQSDTFAHCMDDLNFPQLAPLLELVPNLGGIRLSANRICNKSMKALAARRPSCARPLRARRASAERRARTHGAGSAPAASPSPGARALEAQTGLRSRCAREITARSHCSKMPSLFH